MRRVAEWAVALPPRRQDLLVALLLAAYNLGSVIPETRQLRFPYLAYAFVVLQVLPLTWRRSWPVVVYFACGIPRTLYDLLGIGFAPLPLGPAIAYYTVMDRSSTRVRWAISLVLASGIIEGQLTPGHTEPYDFFIAVLQFAVAGVAGILSRTHRTYVQAIEVRAEHAEAERDRQVGLAAAAERARIARELHDVVAHHVSLMAVQSEAAAALLPDRPVEAGKSVQIIGDTAREALADLRRLLGVLHGPADLAGRRAATAPSPTISDLDDVLVQVRQAGIAVDLRVVGSPSKLTAGVDLTAYRIVQEALTNTIRHSDASEAAVTVSYEPGFVTVSVIDKGNGLAAATAGRDAMPVLAEEGRRARNGTGTRSAGTGGFGLAGIAERVASCGGSLTVGPATTGGFAVTARLPAS